MIELEQNLKRYSEQIFGVRQLFDSADYIHAFAMCRQAIFYSAVFMPPLQELEGSILLAQSISSPDMKNGFLEAKSSGEWELAALEKSFNYVEVGYIFGTTEDEEVDDDYAFLAIRLRDAWEGWLHVQYPDRKFHVQIIGPEESTTTEVVTFYEER